MCEILFEILFLTLNDLAKVADNFAFSQVRINRELLHYDIDFFKANQFHRVKITKPLQTLYGSCTLHMNQLLLKKFFGQEPHS